MSAVNRLRPGIDGRASREDQFVLDVFVEVHRPLLEVCARRAPSGDEGVCLVVALGLLLLGERLPNRWFAWFRRRPRQSANTPTAGLGRGRGVRRHQQTAVNHAADKKSIVPMNGTDSLDRADPIPPPSAYRGTPFLEGSASEVSSSLSDSSATSQARHRILRPANHHHCFPSTRQALQCAVPAERRSDGSARKCFARSVCRRQSPRYER